MSKKHHHHHHEKCQSCNKHRPHYHEHCHNHHCHHHHHKHHDHHHHKRHCYHHKRYYRHHIVCPPVPPTPTITYSCSGSPNYECGPVLDGTGYATLLECQTACAAPGILLLGTAANFRVLANQSITNSGNTIIDGDLGLSPNDLTSITGFLPGIVNGGIYAADPVALQAQADLTIAYDAVAAALPVTHNYSGIDLGTLTLVPGIYKFDTSAGLTGTLVLDAQGDPNAVWMFQIGSTLTTATDSIVSVINSGRADNIFWQVGSSATLGETSTFVGNILALTTISVGTGANISGRLLASNASVTLLGNAVGP